MAGSIVTMMWTYLFMYEGCSFWKLVCRKGRSQRLQSGIASLTQSTFVSLWKRMARMLPMAVQRFGMSLLKLPSDHVHPITGSISCTDSGCSWCEPNSYAHSEVQNLQVQCLMSFLSNHLALWIWIYWSCADCTSCTASNMALQTS